MAALGGFIADSVSCQLIFGPSAAGRLLGMALFTSFTVQLVKKASVSASQGGTSRRAWRMCYSFAI